MKKPQETELIELAEKFMIDKFGLLPSVDKIKSIDKRYVITIKADYPKIIKDDKTNENIIKFITINSIGKLQISSGRVIEFTPRDMITKNILDTLSLQKMRIETELVRVAAPNLSKLKEALQVLEPYKMFLTEFYHNNSVKISELEEFGPEKSRKYIQYLRLLEDLDLIKKEENKFIYTSKMAQIQASLHNFDSFRRKIIEIIMQRRYTMLKEVFNIQRFEPYIRLSNSYYKPSIEANKMLYLLDSSLFYTYSSLYDAKPSLKFRSNLRDLVEIEVLRKENEYYHGTPKIFNKLTTIAPMSASDVLLPSS